jgi:DNA-binding MarR family transcriptional regulator
VAKTEKLTPDVVLAGMARHPEATAAELAEAVGIGKSTATRYLAALEADGKARRIPGGWNEGRRFADRWSMSALAPVATTADAPLSEVAGGGNRDTGADESTSSDPSRRLGRGALGGLILAFLAARPDESFGPSSLGKALERSAGAVSNSLAAMAERGEVELVSDKPRRYRIALRK